MTLNLPFALISVEGDGAPVDLDPQTATIIKVYSEFGGGQINLLPIDPPNEALDGLFLQIQSLALVGNVLLKPKDPLKMNATPDTVLAPFVAVDIIYSFRENKWLVGKFL